MPKVNDDSAIVQDKTIYGKKTKAVPKPEKSIGIDTEKQILDNIYQAGEVGQIDMSSIENFSRMADNREQIYQLLDTMSEDSIIASILETYAEDATEYNDNGQIVWVEASDSNIGKYVSYLLDTMQVDKNAYKWIYSLIKYGDLYLQLFKQSEYDAIDEFFDDEEEIQRKKALNEDLKVKAYKDSDRYAHYVEAVANPAEMFELIKFGKTVGYIKADVTTNKNVTDNMILPKMKYKFKKSDVTIYDPTKFVHATLEDNSTRTPEEVSLYLNEDKMQNNDGVNYTVKRGQSLLYSSYKIWRELSLLENSLLLNRITKSAITRLINVEIGDMPKEMVGPHLQGIKQMMEQKASINAGSNMTEYTNPGPIENNIYVPTHGGIGAISASTIGGDVDNIGKLYDIDYFQNKYFGSMRIPKQYFGLTDDGAGFNGGESLAIISARYAKAIKRIQNALIQAITDAINLMLLDKDLNNYVNQFTIKMQPPTTKEEMDRREFKQNMVGLSSDIMNMLGDIEDVPTKLKIEKALLSNIISDSEVIDLIQEEIDRLENELNNNSQTPNADDEMNGEIGDTGMNDMPLNLDSALGIETEEGAESEETDTLPSPEDLGIDMTDNNNPDLSTDEESE